MGRNVVIKQNINVEDYWEIIVFYNVSLGKGIYGYTKTDYTKRLSIVCISTHQDPDQVFNTIIHEAKHVQSHICKYYNVREDGEQAAYLIGYITMKMFQCFKNFL